MKPLDRAIVGLCTLILLTVAIQAFFPAQYVSVPQVPKTPVIACAGAPIVVDFPFTGGVNEPWTCKVQCDDDEPRYILYTNGKATQCEIPPGCNDTGEDSNITCTPPANSTK